MIERVAWSDDEVRLGLGHAGTIAVGGGFYRILAVADELPPSSPAVVVTVTLRQHRFVWRRREWLERLHGRRLRRIFVTPDQLYLYGDGILAFGRLVDSSTGRLFLFWSPSD